MTSQAYLKPRWPRCFPQSNYKQQTNHKIINHHNIFKMSSKICTSFFTAFFYFLLLISSPAITTKMNGTCYGLAAARPLKSQNYATLKPETSHERHKFRGRAVDNCMPKGVFHRNSAPSKYINYHTFGSTLCTSPAKHASKTSKPWENKRGKNQMAHYAY